MFNLLVIDKIQSLVHLSAINKYDFGKYPSSASLVIFTHSAVQIIQSSKHTFQWGTKTLNHFDQRLEWIGNAAQTSTNSDVLKPKRKTLWYKGQQQPKDKISLTSVSSPHANWWWPNTGACSAISFSELYEDGNREMLAWRILQMTVFSLQEQEHVSRAHPSFSRKYTELGWSSSTKWSTHSVKTPPCYSSPTTGSEDKLLMACHFADLGLKKMLETGNRRHRNNLTRAMYLFYYMLG